MGRYAPGHTVRGEIKEDRDLVLYTLWEMGVFWTEEIGQAFGPSYSDVSRVVRDVKEQIKKGLRVSSKVKSVNSQF
jgi:hypothetical protein